jgi:small subunit ribosomal protein S24e
MLELKIRQEQYNALLKRKEIYAEVDHDRSGTPSRVDLRKAIASKYGVKPDSVYVIDVKTKTGTQSALCEVQVYDAQEGAQRTVPKYIQTRHLPPEERKSLKEQKAKKAEAKPAEEKTKEKPKEDKTKQEPKAPAEGLKKEKEDDAK